MENKMPQLGDLFFAVCQTAISNSAWKHADFEKVKFVEGQLEALRLHLLSAQLAGTPQVETKATETTNASVEVKAPHHEAPVASEGIISPDKVKDLPARPMPPEILEAVQDGIELAKNPPRVADVKVEELSNDPDIAREQFSR